MHHLRQILERVDNIAGKEWKDSRSRVAQLYANFMEKGPHFKRVFCHISRPILWESIGYEPLALFTFSINDLFLKLSPEKLLEGAKKSRSVFIQCAIELRNNRLIEQLGDNLEDYNYIYRILRYKNYKLLDSINLYQIENSKIPSTVIKLDMVDFERTNLIGHGGGHLHFYASIKDLIKTLDFCIAEMTSLFESHLRPFSLAIKLDTTSIPDFRFDSCSKN